MDEDSYLGLVREIFAHSPHGSDDLVGRLHFTFDGVLASASSSCGKLGFGVASGITPTSAVLSIVEDLNRLMSFGHYWLAAGADDSNWSLVCGFKIPYESDLRATGDLIAGIMQHNGALVAAVREKLGEIPHDPYWLSDAEPGAQALVLTSHLT